VLKKFEDEYGNEYPTTGMILVCTMMMMMNLMKKRERLSMEDQQEQLIDKDEFDCDSED
jgi:hypothetical protein